MTLRAVRRCSWDEIKINEVFAINGCWVIAQKVCKYSAIYLADDFLPNWFGVVVEPYYRWNFEHHEEKLYKLPKSVQRLWKEE